jgi:hypothetical protein
MKLFIKVMLLVVAALAGPFIIKGPNGKPLMSLDRVRVPAISLPGLAKAATAVKGSVSEASETPAKPIVVFKWCDKNGRWHFSDTAKRGQPAQSLSVDPGANVLHFAATDNPRTAAPTVGGSHNQQDSSTVLTGASGNMGTLSNLIGAAKNVGPLQEQRAARLEHAMQE